MSNKIAQVSLDFAAREACVLAAKKLTHMDAQLAETTIKTYLNESAAGSIGRPDIARGRCLCECGVS